jgi:hypothetical protein
MSGLFGSAGMGLAGYKMAKRTRGISEFVFESEENFSSKFLLMQGDEGEDDVDTKKNKEKEKEKDEGDGKWSSPFDKKKKNVKKESDTKENGCPLNHLSVMICVSGWMIHKEDYKKSFGIVPHDMQDEERLRRFYQIHCPQKVDRAAEDIQAWKNSGCTSGAAMKAKEGSGSTSFGSFKHSVSSNFGNISSAVGMYTYILCHSSLNPKLSTMRCFALLTHSLTHCAGVLCVLVISHHICCINCPACREGERYGRVLPEPD